jgi:shikimate dehydrogenase
MTSFVGLIGRGLKHTISPAFQQAAFDHLGQDIRYQTWDTEEADLAALVDSIRGPSKLGANITIPYKRAVLPLLDDLDRDASRIGAVNTIVNREGKLAGYNTDSGGFLRALYQDGDLVPRGKAAVILGAGGAARAVGFTLLEAGVGTLTLINRTPERAEALACDLERSGQEVRALPWEDGRIAEALGGCDLLVNCTSVGLRGSQSEGQSPLPAHLIPRRALVYDLVYNPVETELLRLAAEAGTRTLGGLPMLVYQGAASFELWTGASAPVNIMMDAARSALEG